MKIFLGDYLLLGVLPLYIFKKLKKLWRKNDKK
jgi:hypothetical protein